MAILTKSILVLEDGKISAFDFQNKETYIQPEIIVNTLDAISQITIQGQFKEAINVDITIQTDDGNGGTFDQIFTIDVERVDDGNVRLPADPNFSDVGRGLLEDDRNISDSDRSPLIQNFVNGSGFDGNAYYGETSLGQIIRENITFEIA